MLYEAIMLFLKGFAQIYLLIAVAVLVILALLVFAVPDERPEAAPSFKMKVSMTIISALLWMFVLPIYVKAYLRNR